MNLSASHISFSAGRKHILHDVSVELTPGSFTAIVGPNGAGKSTLLKILSRDIKPTGGEVTLLGRPLVSFKAKELSKVRSVLSQQATVAFPFTAAEVVGLGLYIHRITRHEADAIVHEVMKETGVHHLQERLYPTLSGGEQQRVQLARALAQLWEDTVYPRFLLLDEPTNNLDITHQHGILSAARRMLGKNLAVLAIVHDLNLATQYADRIIFMKDGNICANGTPADVMTKAIIEAIFNHPVNVFYDDQEKPFVMALPNRHPVSNELLLNNTTHEQLSYYK